MHPDGTIEKKFTVTLDARNPTSVSFGGDDYKTLFITTARRRLSPEEIENVPGNGGVYAVRLEGFQGVPEPVFKIPEGFLKLD